MRPFQFLGDALGGARSRMRGTLDAPRRGGSARAHADLRRPQSALDASGGGPGSPLQCPLDFREGVGHMTLHLTMHVLALVGRLRGPVAGHCE